MARTAITPVVPTPLGVAAAPVAVDASASPNGMQVKASPHLAIRVITTGTLTAVTIQTNETAPEGRTVTPTAVNTPTTGTTWFLLNRSWMVQSDGNVYLNFSSATGATIEAIDMGA